MVSPVLGQTIGALSTLVPQFRTWNMENLDTGEKLQGQFEAQEVTEQVGSNWAEHTALNRDNAILQFLNGNNDQLSFTARLYQDSILGDPLLGRGQLASDSGPIDKLKKLKQWIRRDPKLRRPPIINFSIGSGHVQMTCVIRALSDITYDRPDYFGGFKGVSLSVGLLQFVPFSIEDQEETDTRYAVTRDRDYYEMMALVEYGNPMLGDFIRKEHPKQQSPQPGDIVRLPAIETARKQRIQPKSIPLKGAYSRKDTSQRQLRLEFFALRQKSKTSHILQPSTTPI